MWDDLLRALALVMIIEGLMPFLVPERWRQMLLQITTVEARTLRLFGGGVVAAGVLLLQLLGS